MLLELSSIKSPIQMVDDGGHPWMICLNAPYGFPSFGSFGRCDELFGAWSSEHPHWEDMGGIAMQDAMTSPLRLSSCGLDPFGDGEGTLFIGAPGPLGRIWLAARAWMESSVKTFDPDVLVSTREGACVVCARFSSPDVCAVWMAGRLEQGVDTKFPVPEGVCSDGTLVACVSHMRGTPSSLLEMLLTHERHFLMANPPAAWLLTEISEGASGSGPRSPSSVVSSMAFAE